MQIICKINAHVLLLENCATIFPSSLSSKIKFVLSLTPKCTLHYVILAEMRGYAFIFRDTFWSKTKFYCILLLCFWFLRERKKKLFESTMIGHVKKTCSFSQNHEGFWFQYNVLIICFSKMHSLRGTHST